MKLKFTGCNSDRAAGARLFGVQLQQVALFYGESLLRNQM
jgi:hypothetical protein